HVVLGLICADRALLDQERVVLGAAEELYAREQPRGEQPVLVVEHGAAADRAGADVELVVDEIHVTLVRETDFVREAHAYRIRDVARARALTRAGELLIAQIRVLVPLEVDVDRVYRDDRREQRTAAVAAGDEIAARDFGAARLPVDWRLHLRELEV